MHPEQTTPGTGGVLSPLFVPLAAGLLLVGCGAGADPGPGPADTPVRFVRLDSDVLLADTASSPSASWVDLEGDGDDDLYVLNGFATLAEDPTPQPSVLYRNDGDGSFTRLPDHPLVRDDAFSGSATWADYDNDGDLDVFVANQRGVDNFLYRNEGDGNRAGDSFVRVTEGPVVSDGGRSFSAVWVDIDGDGWLDLHVFNGRSVAGGEVDFVYRNRGDGTFSRIEDVPFAADTLPSGGGAWADYDDDGDVDLFLPVYAPSRRARLYRNDGAWSFTEVSEEAGLTPDPLPSYPRTSVAQWVDYDHDADLDLFVGNTGGTLDYLWENDGAGRFRKASAGRLGLDATYVSDATWADVDNDADLDLVVAVWGGASELYLNDGSGRMHPVDAGQLGDVVTFASSVSAGDVDVDGALDLYLTQWPINDAGGAPNLLYRNDTHAANWLKIDLEGTTSNRSAVGARIVVSAEVDGRTRRQLRQVSARTSWRSTGSLIRHFGLNDARRVDAVEVTWPSGRVDRVDGPLEVNRRLTIVEGRGLAAGAGRREGGEAPAGDTVAVRLTAGEDAYAAAEPIALELVLRNGGADTLRLEFSTGQRFDFAVRDAAAEVRWRWSAGKAFTQALGTEVVPPGDTLVYRATLEEGLEAGRYTVIGEVTARDRSLVDSLRLEVGR